MLEARGSLLGFQSGHQTVEGLDIVERSAATLIVVPLEFHQLKVLVQRLQVGQTFLQAFRGIGEPRKIADSVGIDHIRRLHHFHVGGPGNAGQLTASVVQLRWEHDRVAATARGRAAATATAAAATAAAAAVAVAVAVAAAAAAAAAGGGGGGGVGGRVCGAAANDGCRRSNVHGAQTILGIHQVMMMRGLGFLDLVYVRQ